MDIQRAIVGAVVFGALAGCAEVVFTPPEREVLDLFPLDPIPEDAPRKVGVWDPAGPPKGEALVEEEVRPPAADSPRLNRVWVEPAVVRTGERVRFWAEVVGPAGGEEGVEVFLNLGHLARPPVVRMNPFSQGLYTHELELAGDERSANLVFYVAAGRGERSFGVQKGFFTVVGGDFHARQGFEGEDARLDVPFPFPEDPAGAPRLRGLHLKDGLWTLVGGWVGEEGALEGQYGLVLGQGGNLISPWFPHGAKVWFRARVPAATEIRLWRSTDGKRWVALPFLARPTSKGDHLMEAVLGEDFHGYLRWEVHRGTVSLDQVRVWKRVRPRP